MPADTPAVPQCVALAGGGSGGHLIPGLAVARELARAGVKRIVFLGTARGLETRLVPQAGFELRLIRIEGLLARGPRRQARTLLQLPGAIWKSRRILHEVGAEAVLGIGGYASGPGLAAARWRGLPIVVLEVNAQAGLANRLAARWADMAAVNFPETARQFPHATVTGIPVREEIFRVGPRPPGAEPCVLVFGGSQGSRALNRAVTEFVALARSQGMRLWVVHQTGAAEFASVVDTQTTSAETDVTVETLPFIEDMAAAYAAADVVVCRAGASTLGELAAAGRAAILVPLPGAGGHQVHNAAALESAGAALVLPQAQLNGKSLAQTIGELLASPQRREAMVAAQRKFARPGAARQIAELVIQASSLGAKPPFAGR